MPQIRQSDLPIVPCVILAGGKSRRFGSDKALAHLHGVRLIDVLIQELKTQTCGPISIISNNDYGLEDHPILKDRLEGDIGPLAGIHAALCWAHETGFDAVVTTPVDTPILPDDFISNLWEKSAPSVAVCNNRIHAVHGIWSVMQKDELESAIRNGMRAVQAWVELSKAKHCVFASGGQIVPFFNVNTAEDLIALAKAQSVSPR